MLKFDVRVTKPDVLKRIAEDFPKATLRALNKVGRSAEVKANRRIREVYNISRSEVDAGINVRTASIRRLVYTIVFKGDFTPIIRFVNASTAARALSRSGHRVLAVPFTIKKGSRKSVKRWFIQRMPDTGHVGVFTRTGSSRLPIKQRFTLSIGQMFKGVKVLSEVKTFISEEFPKVIQHEVSWWLQNRK